MAENGREAASVNKMIENTENKTGSKQKRIRIQQLKNLSCGVVFLEKQQVFHTGFQKLSTG
jgi:hypothetical protein